MLTKQTCTNVEYVYPIDIQQESFKFFYNNGHDVSLSDLGKIIGCAIYFKDRDGLTERVVASGYFGRHHEIEQFLIHDKKINVYSLPSQDICLGFVTDKGYYLDRTSAMLVYRELCKKAKIVEPIEGKKYLHGYNIDWSALQKL